MARLLLAALLSLWSTAASSASCTDSSTLFQIRPQDTLLKNATGRTGLPETSWSESSDYSWLLKQPHFDDGIGLLMRQERVVAAKDVKIQNTINTDATGWIVVSMLLILQIIAVAPVAYYDSLPAFVVVLLYLLSITAVKLFVKETINHGFSYPSCITCFHMIGVCLLILGAGERPRWKEAVTVLPVAALNGASLLTGNASLVFVGLAFVSMLSAACPCVVFLLEVLKGTRPLCHFMTIVAVTIVCLGSMFCIRGQSSTVQGISFMGFFLASLSTVLRAMRVVWQHDLLRDKNITVSPLHLVFWNSFWTLWGTVLAMIVTGEHFGGFLHLFDASWGAQLSLILSVVSAATMNITQWYAVKKHGALMQQILGNLHLVSIIAISIAMLGEETTMIEYVGALFLVTGTVINKVDQSKTEEEAMETEEASPQRAK